MLRIPRGAATTGAGARHVTLDESTPMKIELAPGERMLKEGAANLQRGIETVGGRLFLTERRLVFASHAFNVQTGVTDIPLTAIRSSTPCWTRFLGLIPLAPNSLEIRTDSSEHRFVLFGRTEWARAINEAMAARGDA